MVVQEIVGVSGFGIQDIGKKLKVKTFAQQLCASGFGLAIGVQFRQNPVIFAQLVVDVAHKVGAVCVDFVVVSIATTVTAELLVLATHNFFSAF